MTIDEYFNKQDFFNHWEYVGEIDGVQLYVFYNSGDRSSRSGFPWFVIDDGGRFSHVENIKQILKYNAFYNDSFPDEPDDRK